MMVALERSPALDLCKRLHRSGRTLHFLFREVWLLAQPPSRYRHARTLQTIA
jgi:hypothetical protein